MELNFSPIPSTEWMKFQTITQKYFDELKKDNESFTHIIDVKTVVHGKGTDDGVDILLTLSFDDTIFQHQFKWVVQCKCYDGTVAPKDINDINIPTLVHSHQAQGYLLVCKNGVTSGITKLFKALNEKCKMKYQYTIWTGEDFLFRIQSLNKSDAYLKRYFSDYYNFTKAQEAKYVNKKEELKPEKS